VKDGMPELPEAMQARFVEQYGLTRYDAAGLTSSKATAAYYEAVVAKAGAAQAKTAANWVMGDVSAQLNREALDIADSPVSAAQLVRHPGRSEILVVLMREEEEDAFATHAHDVPTASIAAAASEKTNSVPS